MLSCPSSRASVQAVTRVCLSRRPSLEGCREAEAEEEPANQEDDALRIVKHATPPPPSCCKKIDSSSSTHYLHHHFTAAGRYIPPVQWQVYERLYAECAGGGWSLYAGAEWSVGRDRQLLPVQAAIPRPSASLSPPSARVSLCRRSDRLLTASPSCRAPLHRLTVAWTSAEWRRRRCRPA